MHGPSCPHGITLHADVMKILLNHSCLAKQLALPLANFVQSLKSYTTCAGPHSSLNDVLSYKDKMQDTNKALRVLINSVKGLMGFFFYFFLLLPPPPTSLRGKKRQSERPKWTQLEQSPVYD